MAIFELTAEKLVELQSTRFSAHGLREREDLQRLLRDRIDVLMKDVLVVAEEFADWQDSRRRIDLLGIDKNANLVVIELKRTEDGGHSELQALRYAAMISKMTFDKLVETFQTYLSERNDSKDARAELLEFLGWVEPEEEAFAQSVKIVLAAADFDREITSSVLWLNEQGLDIRCVRIRPYTDGGRVLIDVQQLLPLPEANDYFVNLRAKTTEVRESRRRTEDWSRLWYVNVGMNDGSGADRDLSGKAITRHWNWCSMYGYVSAGHGVRYSKALRKLPLGATIAAYQRGVGYLGYGKVTKVAQPFHDFKLPNGKSLADELGRQDLNAGREEDMWEWAVGVEWIAKTPLERPYAFKGIFANQNVVCKLTDEKTVRFLEESFGVKSGR